MLSHRLLTAIVGLPCLLYLLVLGHSQLVLGFLSIVALGASLEVYKIVEKGLTVCNEEASNKESHQFYTQFLLFCSLLFFPGSVLVQEQFQMIFVVMAIAVFSALLLIPGEIDVKFKKILSITFSLLYACIPWIFVWKLYLLADNAGYLILLLAISMCGDSSAYFSGRFLGKRLMSPVISPKKTYEGLLGGVIGSCLGALGINYLYESQLGSWQFILLLAVVGSLFGVLGDLFESLIKRYGKVKDSGRLLPGHGGVLDRTDSIIFAAPLVWAIVYISFQPL